ncbi:hypothetical protein OC846_001606 [Tilletia horrida]|uniref:Transmembrane protein n=1 Tax=Tilletia horrida TaxID=155126 RepID=A0AAN6JSW4_9BASI|nr:hypothetical protein OC846_001606 [Tilletia horrida]KAK0569511.1 hypothetical protein OC861_000884 [Tilletia horrida]
MKIASLTTFLLLATYAVAAPMSVDPSHPASKGLPKGTERLNLELVNDHSALENGQSVTQVDARAELPPSKFNLFSSFVGFALAVSALASVGQFYQKTWGRDLEHIPAPPVDLDQKIGALDVSEVATDNRALDSLPAEKRADYEALGGLVGVALGTVGSFGGLVIAYMLNQKLQALQLAKEKQDREQHHKRDTNVTTPIIYILRRTSDDGPTSASTRSGEAVHARAFELVHVAVTLELAAAAIAALGVPLGIANIAAMK